MVLWQRQNGLISLELVQQIESLLKYKFPREYLDVVLLYNEGNPEPNRFDTTKRKGYIMDRLLTLLNEPTGLIRIISYVTDGLPDGIVPFGYEITGDIICFDFKHHLEVPSVVLWKHEFAPDEEDVGSQEEMRRTGLEYINDSFRRH